MSDQELKTKIENHIKNLLFNSNASSPPPPPPPSSSSIPSNSDLNYNMGPYIFGDKNPFSPNTADTQPKEKLLSSISLDCSFLKQPSSSSQLIDLNVLTDFAAKHADIDEITNSSRVLPHPDLENDSPTSPGASISKNSILLNCTRKTVENKSPSKFPYYCESLPGENVKNFDRNCIRPEHATDAERASSDKRKQRGKKNRKNAKEKAPRKANSMAEAPANQSVPSPKKESPKREIINVNKHRLSQKEAPCIPEKRRQIGIGYVCDPEANQQRLPDELRAPLPVEETEYTISLTRDGYKLICHICNYEAKTRDYIHKHLTSENHRELKKQIQSDRVLPFLPKPLPDQIEAISELLMKCHTEHGLQEEDLLIREKIAERLIEFINENVPGCTVDMIGSSATGLGLKNSKVDFILKVAQEQNIPDSLELLYKKLPTDSAYCDVESVFNKKRLGILFTDKETGLECSIILETAFSDKFARLFTMYSELDPRVKILASCFRYWAKLCSLDNQDRGTLPPYTFSILLVYFLQQIEPPVLPVLHEVKEYGNSNFVEQYIKGKVWKTKNDCSVGELWIKLFYFYNFDYEMGKHVICVRSSDKVMCSEKNWSTKFYAIEDPFSRRNIAHVIPNFQVCQYIQQCFLKTYRYFAFPQTKDGDVKLLRTEEFESLLLSYVSAKSEAKDYSDEESNGSDNEDSSVPDESSILQDFEDHDPDVPIESVLSTLKQMSLEENKSPLDEEMTEDPQDLVSSSQQNSVKVESPKKEAKLNKEKIMKAEERQRIQGACSWDLKNHKISRESFEYKMDPSFFKNRKDVPFSCKQCKSSGHLKKNCPKDDLPPRMELPEMTSEYLRLINRILCYIRDKNCVDDDDKDFMLSQMKNIELQIQKFYPEASLSMFGSFCNGFGFKSRSDMDFCLTFKNMENSKGLDSAEVIENVAKQLRRFPKLENIVPVTSAKVPIVKFSCAESGLEGDISLYNTLAIANTEMLEMYSRIDRRVQILGFALKYFAKVLGICDASRGSLSSYAYILMVIYFLQQRQPPVIPVLQELHGEEKPTVMVDGWNVWFFKDLDNLHEVWPEYGKNKETIAELWLALLSFYAYDFDWKEYVVSIKQKAPLTRFRKLWITDQIAIEDPFDLSHNLGAGLSRKMNMYILRTFIRGRERFGTPLCPEDYKRVHGHEISFLFERRFLNSGTEPPHDRGCRICGKIGHIAKNCTQEKICAYCKKPGHIAKNCPVKKSKPKNKHTDKSTKEPFSKFESRNNMDIQNLQGHHPLRPQSGDIQRTNNAPFNMVPKNSDDRDSRKLIQMGFPTHRHPPPPGFPTNFTNPPPGFQAMHQNSTKFPRFPSSAPFPRAMPMNNMSQSPPKHYSCSPPKNYMGNSMYHPESAPSLSIRQDMHMSPSDTMIHRIWQNQLPNRMPQQYSDRRKRTN